MPAGCARSSARAAGRCPPAERRGAGAAAVIPTQRTSPARGCYAAAVRVELDDDERALLARARQAALSAWAPYSRFRVGAALAGADGRVFLGANVENASFGLTMCAERVALFQGVIAGGRPFGACAVACVDAPAALGASARTPCGACRQLLAEHMPPDGRVIVDGAGVYRVEELLPAAFRFEPPR